MSRGLLILSFLGIAFASRSANQYIENVLQTSLPHELRSLGLDPAAINNFIVRFGSRSEGEATFINGNITGFARVKRSSECSGPKTFRGELTINCTLKLYPLTTNYKVTVRNGSAISYGRVVGNVGETLVYVMISGQSPNYVGSVRSFQVIRLGVVSPKFSGISPVFKKYVNSMQTGYITTVSSYLYNVIQQRFVYALGRALAYKPMPRQ